jgi:hypothetical protein
MGHNWPQHLSGSMSQLGQTEKNSVRAHVFRFAPLNSDIARRSRHVSNVPARDSCPTAINSLFDHLIGKWRHGESTNTGLHQLPKKTTTPVTNPLNLTSSVILDPASDQSQTSTEV